MLTRIRYADGTSEVLEFENAEGGWLVSKQDITIRSGQAFIIEPVGERAPDDMPEDPLPRDSN